MNSPSGLRRKDIQREKGTSVFCTTYHCKYDIEVSIPGAAHAARPQFKTSPVRLETPVFQHPGCRLLPTFVGIRSARGYQAATPLG
jgi:hypothetical protein